MVGFCACCASHRCEGYFASVVGLGRLGAGEGRVGEERGEGVGDEFAGCGVLDYKYPSGRLVVVSLVLT